MHGSHVIVVLLDPFIHNLLGVAALGLQPRSKKAALVVIVDSVVLDGEGKLHMK